ncbi:hypothetical protein PISMIDRAFT_16252 [Pisolithus microcarpus 441]|uniref:Uncharacterized protein n=1 Tax=Pisolithus microcarpus 441 TaxID=765257 RepID=A0A0C9Z0F9_9AGAM|nr:hypothetical protein PISMIDRAFT_16252 [Pisolithus microcarpus 441]
MTIVPWEVATLEELEDKLGDSAVVKMAKFDERQCCQHLTLQQELKEEEQRKVQEAKRIHREKEAEAWKKAEEQKICELEAKHKRLEEETRQAQQTGGSLSQQVLASTGKAVERPNGCSMCIKAGEECKPRTGRSKSCIWCQKLKAKCDLITWMMDTEKRPVETTSPQGGEKWKHHRKSKASMEVVVDVDDGDDEEMEDTLDVEMVSHPRVLRTLPPHKDSVAEVLDQRLGEVMRLLQKNNTAIETLAGDVQDLSGVLEELFKALKTVMMALVSQAQNTNNI